jgi:hypothetical protein
MIIQSTSFEGEGRDVMWLVAGHDEKMWDWWMGLEHSLQGVPWASGRQLRRYRWVKCLEYGRVLVSHIFDIGGRIEEWVGGGIVDRGWESKGRSGLGV